MLIYTNDCVDIIVTLIRQISNTFATTGTCVYFDLEIWMHY